MPIAAAQSREALPDEFEDLFRDHYQLLYRTAYGITGNRHDAEDVLQSVFVKLLQNGPSSGLKYPARYLHRAAVNLSLNLVRARKRQKLVGGVEHLAIPVDPGHERNRAQDIDEHHERLLDAMTRLNAHALEILLLHYKHGYSDAQIAKLLGTSRGVVAVTLYRIRARLRKFLRTAGSDGERA